MPLSVLLNVDDPNFVFEHMMQHRRYFALLDNLSQVSGVPYLLDPSFNTNMPAWPWNFNHQQAHDDFNRELPSNYASGFNLHTVTPPTATGTGTSTGTLSLTMTGVAGTILLNAVIVGSGVPAGTKIVSQSSGTDGGDGVYITNQVTTLAGVALMITHPPYQQATQLDGGTFGIPQAGILIEGTGGTPENRSWWTFANHQQHLAANNAIMPLPTTQPITAGTPPGVETVSDPWWWASKSPIIFPFW